MYPKNFINLVNFLKKLPGVGSKTAERFGFQMLRWSDEDLNNFGSIVKNLKKTIKKCSNCSSLIEESCCFCSDEGRNKSQLCILSSFKDLVLLEGTNIYKGLYHIIDHLISPIEGFDVDGVDIPKIKKRIKDLNIKELIIALDSTVEGDATSLYIKEELKDTEVVVSRLAFGLPIGTSLDYIDGGTLMQALIGRKSF